MHTPSAEKGLWVRQSRASQYAGCYAEHTRQSEVLHGDDGVLGLSGMDNSVDGRTEPFAID